MKAAVTSREAILQADPRLRPEVFSGGLTPEGLAGLALEGLAGLALDQLCLMRYSVRCAHLNE